MDNEFTQNHQANRMERPVQIMRLLRWTTLTLNALGTVLIMVLGLVVNADVVGRSFFSHPIYGVTEFASLALVAIVFLQIGAATTANRLTRSDMILLAIKKVSPRTAAALECLFDLCASLLFLALTYASWTPLLLSWSRDEYIGVAGMGTLPTWPVRAIIILSSVLLTAHFAAKAVSSAREAVQSSEEPVGKPREVKQ